MAGTGDDACFCGQVGPLLVAPGTSGRTWVCGSCGREWSPAEATVTARPD